MRGPVPQALPLKRHFAETGGPPTPDVGPARTCQLGTGQDGGVSAKRRRRLPDRDDEHGDLLISASACLAVLPLAENEAVQAFAPVVYRGYVERPLARERLPRIRASGTRRGPGRSLTCPSNRGASGHTAISFRSSRKTPEVTKSRLRPSRSMTRTAPAGAGACHLPHPPDGLPEHDGPGGRLRAAAGAVIACTAPNSHRVLRSSGAPPRRDVGRDCPGFGRLAPARQPWPGAACHNSRAG